MLKVAICEDNTVFLANIAKRIKDDFLANNAMIQLDLFSGGNSFLEQYQLVKHDIVFLDIEMPEIDGFQIAEKINQMNAAVYIVFVSEKEDQVFHSYRYQPYWFIRKSNLENLSEAIEKLVKKLGDSVAYLCIPTDSGNIKIKIQEIQYIEIHGHYATIHANGQAYQKKTRLKDLEEEFKDFFFTRCHVSFLVNCHFIREIKQENLVLLDGTKVFMSRNRLKETQLTYQRFLRELRLRG